MQWYLHGVFDNMNNKFTLEPLMTNTQYIGWGYEFGIVKILVKEHQRISVEDTNTMQYV